MTSLTGFRTTKQDHRNIGFKPKDNYKDACSSKEERDQLNKIILCLKEAKSAKKEDDFIRLVSDAHRITRQIVRSRII